MDHVTVKWQIRDSAGSLEIFQETEGVLLYNRDFYHRIRIDNINSFYLPREAHSGLQRDDQGGGRILSSRKGDNPVIVSSAYCALKGSFRFTDP
jgi:hypothetical protein